MLPQNKGFPLSFKGSQWYLMVEEGKWTCVACMDRKVRNWKDVLRHEKSGEHTRAMATRLQTIGNSFSGVPGSADAETTVSTLQDLLLNLAGEHGETSEQDTPGMVGSVDGEGSNKVLDVSVLSASLLAQFDNDDGLDTHQVSSLELEGRGQRGADDSGIVPLKRIKLQPQQDLNPWFPWPNKIACTLDVLMHLPRSAFSHRQLDVLLWLLRVNDIALDIPSLKSIKNLETKLHSVHGIRTLLYNGAFGNKYYVNSIADIISQEMANPQVRPHLRFYPEDSGRTVNEYYQAAHWRTEVSPSRLTPMAVIHDQHYYVYEPCLLRDGRACVPVRWFTRKEQLFAMAWVLRAVAGSCDYWVAEEYNAIEISHRDLLIPSVAWDSTPITVGMPRPTELTGLLKSQDGQIQPWEYTDPGVGNRWRHIANGSRVYAFPLWLYCDDTSGNVSKRWNKHNSFLFSPAGLPRVHVHQEYNVHFLCTSNVAEPLEMLEGIVEQLEATWTGGIRAWDHIHQEEILVVPFVCALLGDNPMQSEFACHIGSKGKLFCRMCLVSNSASAENGPTVSDQTSDFTDPPASTDLSLDPPSPEESDLESSPESVASANSTTAVKKNKSESMQGMIDRVTRFVSIGNPRDPSDTRQFLQTMIADSKVVGKKTKVGSFKTETGIKDRYLDHFLDCMFHSYKELRGQDTRQRALDTYCGTLPTTLISPVWRIEGINPHTDTPVEILHTVLLGFVKYFWRDVVQNQIGNRAEKRRLLEIRLSSVNTSGLGLGKLSGPTLVQYAGSLTGRDFRIIAQVAPFVLHGLVSSPCYEAWVSLSNLVPIIWQPQIPDIDEYLVQLHAGIKNFIAFTVKWTPRWFNKPKFHYVLHLEDHIRRFRPAVIFATEVFESYNALIRSKSVHSNRQAPSRDIAIAFAHGNRLRAILCGGKIRVRSLVSTPATATIGSSNPAVDVSAVETCWKQVGPSPMELVERQNIVTDYLGIETRPNISQSGLAVSDGSPPKSYANTKAGLHCPNGLKSPSSLMRFCTYTSVTLKNGDVCTVGDWVLVQSNATNPAVCRIEELLSPLLSDGKIPQYASAILVQHAVLTEVAEVYHMPRVRLVQDEFFLQPLTDVYCVLNLQHDCVTHKCGFTVRGFVRQERQTTSVEERGIDHINPLDLVLNTARMRDAVHMHTLRTKIDTEEIDLVAAIFQGVKSEIDKRKGGVTPRDNSDAAQPSGVNARGRRASRHVAGNGRSSRGRRQGRRGGNV